MENNIPLHFSMFNSKVKLMNQSLSKTLTLSAQEARNLHADIFELLNQYTMLVAKAQKITTDPNTINLNMDGGNF